MTHLRSSRPDWCVCDICTAATPNGLVLLTGCTSQCHVRGLSQYAGPRDQLIAVLGDDAWSAGASEEDEEAFVHSFHLDLRQNPEHRALLEGIFAALQRGLGSAAQHTAAWRSLSAIWMTDKALAVQQLQVE